MDHWLRPEPAKMAPFITGPDSGRIEKLVNCEHISVVDAVTGYVP
jgi:hypothetical protein